MKKLLASSLIALLATASVPAAAVDLGAALLNSGSGSASSVGSASQGGSLSAIAGITAQGSQASANNAGAAGTVVSGNNTFAFSGSAGATAQSGFSASLGAATSVNQNLGTQQGLATGVNALTAQYLFLQP
jgi:hypothetical protein